MNTPLQEYQYMWFNISMIPQEVINHYNLQNKVTEDRCVYCEIYKAIYGLKESGKLINIKLHVVLAIEGYKPCRFTHGLYKHKTQNITFIVVVDNFGVKYINKCDTDHLIVSFSLDIIFKRFCTLTTKWHISANILYIASIVNDHKPAATVKAKFHMKSWFITTWHTTLQQGSYWVHRVCYVGWSGHWFDTLFFFVSFRRSIIFKIPLFSFFLLTSSSLVNIHLLHSISYLLYFFSFSLSYCTFLSATFASACTSNSKSLLFWIVLGVVLLQYCCHISHSHYQLGCTQFLHITMMIPVWIQL